MVGTWYIRPVLTAGSDPMDQDTQDHFVQTEPGTQQLMNKMNESVLYHVLIHFKKIRVPQGFFKGYSRVL